MELKYCVDHAIPHSQFLSWSEADQDKVLGYLLWDAQRCNRCGTVPGEWLDEEGRTAEPPPYVVEARRCIGCATLEEARELVPKDQRGSIQQFYRRPRRGEYERSGWG